MQAVALQFSSDRTLYKISFNSVHLDGYDPEKIFSIKFCGGVLKQKIRKLISETTFIKFDSSSFDFEYRPVVKEAIVVKINEILTIHVILARMS